MGIEENKKVVREFVEALRKYDIATMDELLANDCIIHLMDNPHRDLNREQIKQLVSSNSFRRENHIIEDMIAERDRVSIRFTENDRDTITIARFSIYRIQNGKVAECWTLLDSLSLFQQLGAVPPTGEIMKKLETKRA